MQNTEPARHQEPFFNESDAADDFESALQHAARQNAPSRAPTTPPALICCWSRLSAGRSSSSMATTSWNESVFPSLCHSTRRSDSEDVLHEEQLLALLAARHPISAAKCQKRQTHLPPPSATCSHWRSTAQSELRSSLWFNCGTQFGTTRCTRKNGEFLSTA